MAVGSLAALNAFVERQSNMQKLSSVGNTTSGTGMFKQMQDLSISHIPEISASCVENANVWKYRRIARGVAASNTDACLRRVWTWSRLSRRKEHITDGSSSDEEVPKIVSRFECNNAMAKKMNNKGSDASRMVSQSAVEASLPGAESEEKEERSHDRKPVSAGTLN